MPRRKIFAASGDDGCAIEFVAFLLVIIFFVIILTSSKEETQITSQSVPTATFLPGTPSPVPRTATAIPGPGTPSFACQSGIAAGKTINVVYHSVRMRHSPGYVEKDDAKDSKHYMKTGDKVVVKGGPQIKDGLCWWLVEHNGYQGWTADHSREGSLLLSAGP
jgi:hypothetical protein